MNQNKIKIPAGRLGISLRQSEEWCESVGQPVEDADESMFDRVGHYAPVEAVPTSEIAVLFRLKYSIQ